MVSKRFEPFDVSSSQLCIGEPRPGWDAVLIGRSLEPGWEVPQREGGNGVWLVMVRRRASCLPPPPTPSQMSPPTRRHRTPESALATDLQKRASAAGTNSTSIGPAIGSRLIAAPPRYLPAGESWPWRTSSPLTRWTSSGITPAAPLETSSHSTRAPLLRTTHSPLPRPTHSTLTTLPRTRREGQPKSRCPDPKSADMTAVTDFSNAHPVPRPAKLPLPGRVASADASRRGGRLTAPSDAYRATLFMGAASIAVSGPLVWVDGGDDVSLTCEYRTVLRDRPRGSWMWSGEAWLRAFSYAKEPLSKPSGPRRKGRFTTPRGGWSEEEATWCGDGISRLQAMPTRESSEDECQHLGLRWTRTRHACHGSE
ncbi:hypothetical protein BJ875DRAFT_445024 [Amylocarpus encephaloides]|uniref:Uncharacterized protein n=1 Tax=Amylocarpus encephaloides TaxID=45428 RepID=A0A9P7YC18_9HELO|nr:hypothetical protein BJ875DRAFT_445024 [Amylocarpus encephaloides]